MDGLYLNVPWRLLLGLSLLQLGRTAGGDPYCVNPNQQGSKCFTAITNVNATWRDAQELCTSRGWNFSSILNAEEQQTAARYLYDNNWLNQFRFWIGASLREYEDDKWYWVDGSSKGWEGGWGPNCPEVGSSKYCAWNNMITFHLEDTLCWRQAYYACSNAGYQSCGNSNVEFPIGNKCIRVHHEAVTWSQARSLCAAIMEGNWTLVELSNKDEFDSYIAKLREVEWDNSKPGVWTGLHSARYVWTDGSPMEFTNWRIGHPEHPCVVMRQFDCITGICPHYPWSTRACHATTWTLCQYVNEIMTTAPSDSSIGYTSASSSPLISSDVESTSEIISTSSEALNTTTSQDVTSSSLPSSLFPVWSPTSSRNEEPTSFTTSPTQDNVRKTSSQPMTSLLPYTTTTDGGISSPDEMTSRPLYQSSTESESHRETTAEPGAVAGSLSTVAIVSISLGSLVFILVVVLGIVCWCCTRNTESVIYYTDYEDTPVDVTKIKPVEDIQQVIDDDEIVYINPVFIQGQKRETLPTDGSIGTTSGKDCDDMPILYGTPIKTMPRNKPPDFFNISSKLKGCGDNGETTEVKDITCRGRNDLSANQSDQDTSLTDISSSDDGSPAIPPKLFEDKVQSNPQTEGNHPVPVIVVTSAGSDEALDVNDLDLTSTSVSVHCEETELPCAVQGEVGKKLVPCAFVKGDASATYDIDAGSLQSDVQPNSVGNISDYQPEIDHQMTAIACSNEEDVTSNHVSYAFSENPTSHDNHTVLPLPVVSEATPERTDVTGGDENSAVVDDSVFVTTIVLA